MSMAMATIRTPRYTSKTAEPMVSVTKEYIRYESLNGLSTVYDSGGRIRAYFVNKQAARRWNVVFGGIYPSSTAITPSPPTLADDGRWLVVVSDPKKQRRFLYLWMRQYWKA